MSTCFNLPCRGAIVRSSSRMIMSRGFFALAAAATLLAPVAASAATAAYWRFEDGAILTDSAGSNDLSANGTSPGAYVLPESGAGSAFPDPILGGANGQAADFSGNNGFYATDAFNFGSAMTVEGFFNADTVGGYLLSQWNSTGGNAGASWGLGLQNGTFRVAIAGASTVAANVTLEETIVANKDYYFAMTFDAGVVTVYLQNLTDDTAMVHGVRDVSSSITQLVNSPHQLTIAGLTGDNGASMKAGFDGLLDEIRLSDTVLSVDQFLVSVPEPSSSALLLGAGCLMFLAGSRRRR
ncbi:MAG TPA: hypothetical protein DEA90_07340 [Opitutae bacterium]|nr:hypothetical protein [Puniceicoccaceae bacterium]HBR93964.1 hypothetical protein [Opitutae bacterium]